MLLVMHKWHLLLPCQIYWQQHQNLELWRNTTFQIRHWKLTYVSKRFLALVKAEQSYALNQPLLIPSGCKTDLRSLPHSRSLSAWRLLLFFPFQKQVEVHTSIWLSLHMVLCSVFLSDIDCTLARRWIGLTWEITCSFNIYYSRRPLMVKLKLNWLNMMTTQKYVIICYFFFFREKKMDLELLCFSFLKKSHDLWMPQGPTALRKRSHIDISSFKPKPQNKDVDWYCQKCYFLGKYGIKKLFISHLVPFR